MFFIMHCHKNVIPITKSKIYIYISLFYKIIKLTIYKFKTKTRIYKNSVFLFKKLVDLFHPRVILYAHK